MIIVSQDKVANINYGNIEAIYLLEKNEKIEINVRGKYDYTIGRYETEERAKEITNTFSAAALNGTHDEIDLILKAKFMARYEMPKE